MENLFRFVGLAKILKHKEALAEAGLDLDYLLDNVPIPQTRVARRVPGRSHVKRFEHKQETAGGFQISRLLLPSCGGVGMELTVGPTNFLKDSTGKLAETRSLVLKTRPAGDALFWDYIKPEESN